MIPSRSGAFADLTAAWGPPKSCATLCACAACASRRKAASNAAGESIPRPRPMPATMVSSVSAHPIARIERGCIGIPAALLPQVAHEVVQIRMAQGVLVGRHAGAAVADLLLHRVVVHALAGQQVGLLIEARELRDSLHEFVVAKPALVIKNFLPSLRPARSRLSQPIDLQRALIVILPRRLSLLPSTPSTPRSSL